jgi:hypothetical protein
MTPRTGPKTDRALAPSTSIRRQARRAFLLLHLVSRIDPGDSHPDLDGLTGQGRALQLRGWQSRRPGRWCRLSERRCIKHRQPRAQDGVHSPCHVPAIAYGLAFSTKVGPRWQFSLQPCAADSADFVQPCNWYGIPGFDRRWLQQCNPYGIPPPRRYQGPQDGRQPPSGHRASPPYLRR